MPPIEGMPGVVATRPQTEEYFRLRDTAQGSTHAVAVVEHVVRGELGGIEGGDAVAVFVPLGEDGKQPDDLLEKAKEAAVKGGYMAAPSDWANVSEGLTYLKPGEPSPIEERAVSKLISRCALVARRVLRLAS